MKLWSFLKRKPVETRPTTHVWAILPMNSTMLQIMIDLLPLFRLAIIFNEQLEEIKEANEYTKTVILSIKTKDGHLIQEKMKRMLRLMNYHELPCQPFYYNDVIEILSVWIYNDDYVNSESRI